MQFVDALTLAFRPLGPLALLVHGSQSPSDADWSRYLDAVEEYGREHECVNLLVVTDGAGPSSSQRDQLALRAPKGGRTAVLTSSSFARGIVTLIGWVEPGIRAFAPAAVATALAYLDVPEEEHAAVLRHIEELRAKLARTPVASPSPPRSALGRLWTRLSRWRRLPSNARTTGEVEMAALIEAFEKRDKEFQRDLYDARTFQQHLVTLPAIHGASVHAFYEPMTLIGGDLYAISQQGSKVRVFIADATGHGIRAAMATMVIKNGYQSFSSLENPSCVLEALNDSIASSYDTTDLMFTAACADIDLATGAVTVAAAGHPPACVIRKGKLVLLEPEGAPMGVQRGMKFESVSMALEKGDGLYLYTDGISEARRERVQFGEDRLHESIRRAHVAGADVAAKVRAELLEHVGNYVLSDDASFIGVRL